MKRIKLIIALVFALEVVAALTGQSFGYPPWVAKARKFGAKDCTFCHTSPEGGEGWNERGQWLIKEKERRNADAVDPEWLADYKQPAEAKQQATSSDKPHTPPESDFMKLEQSWVDAIAKHDEAAIRNLLADEFTLTSAFSTGDLINKDQFIKNFMHAISGMSATFQDFLVRTYGDVAVVKFRSNSNYTFNGEDRSGDYLITDVWVKRGGRWQVVTRHATLLLKK
jgi:ketosteroid isomerase-like protein